MYVGSLKAASNRATWTEMFELYDDETNEPVDLAGAQIVVQFRRPGDCAPTLTANVEVVSVGVFKTSLTASQMRSLCAGTYEVGVTITRDGETIQEFIGTIPVLDGVVN